MIHTSLSEMPLMPHVLQRLSFSVAFLSSSLGFAHLGAQTPDVLALRDSLLRVEAQKVVRVVGPQVLTLDPSTQAVAVHLYNPTTDTAVYMLSLSFTSPRRPQLQTAAALLTEDSLQLDSLDREARRQDSLAQQWSLESWVKEPLPVQLWLAPHQTATLTLHMEVPAQLPPGDYSAYVIVKTASLFPLPPLQTALGAVRGGYFMTYMDEWVRPSQAARLVYQAHAN